MTIVITREELVGLGVFNTDLAWFDEHAPSGRAEFPDRTALLAWIARHGTFSFAKWLSTATDVSHHNAQLAGADFTNAYLEGVHFLDASLKEANFARSYLAKADLRRADLRYANLRYANLTEADLRSVNLLSADLSGAILDRAILDGAILSDARRGRIDPPIPGWKTYLDDYGITRLMSDNV